MARKILLTFRAALGLVVLAAALATAQEVDPSAPGMFPIGWNDIAPYLSGLLPAEQTASAALLADGASVYHVQLHIPAQGSWLAAEMALRYTNREAVSLATLRFRAFPPLVGGTLQVTGAEVDGVAAAATVDAVLGALDVPLPEPLAPGGATVVRLTLEIGVPESPTAHYGILGATRGVLSLAHALPTVAVFEDDTWRIETPAEYGDVTYADAAFFLVEVDAPEDLMLVTSGVEIDRTDGEAGRVTTFAAGPVREFYLAAAADLDVVSMRVGETTVRSFAPAALAAAAEQGLASASAALQAYSALYGPYPYTELDLAAVPILAGGMEFPGAVIVGESEYVQSFRPQNEPVDFFELAVAHEVAHQWFYNLVGSDQLGEPWLDESLTQYATWRYFEAVYGEPGDTGFATWVSQRMRALPTPPPPIGQPTSAYSATVYGATVYARGPLFLKALEAELGRDVLDEALRDYVAANRFALADTEIFRDFLEARCGYSLARLFAEWVYAN